MFGGNCNEGTAAGAYTSSVWGIIIFLLILFWVFGNRNGNWNNGFGAMPYGGAFPFGGGFGAWGNNEHTPKDNDNRLSEIKATMDKDTAVLAGQLDVAFREVINNQNENTGKVLTGFREQYISTLERENTKLAMQIQQNAITMQIGNSNAELNRRLDGIECQMLKRPPVYPTVCVPCSSNCCGGGDGGCGCGA